MNGRCKQCKYWKPPTGVATGKGQCRYCPPVVLYDSANARFETMWPATRLSDWCGDFACDRDTEDESEESWED